MDSEFKNLSIGKLCKQLQTGNLPLNDYIETTLKHISLKEPVIHALLPETNRRNRLLQEAKELLTKYPDSGSRPPLFGLLVGVKDLFNVDGLPTRAGSKLPAEAFAGSESVVVTRLKELGALVLGKTISTEFAYFSPGETCNPVNPLHTPGGSSSGSAAAVAAGYCHLALGTQTIASVIRPASYCGVYGFKPSWGRISTEGVFPFSQSADHVGYFCRSIDDIAFLRRYLLIDYQASVVPPVPRIGSVRGEYLAQATDQIRANYVQTVKSLSNKGIRIVEYEPFPNIEEINTNHRRLIAAEFAINHRGLYEQYSELYSPHSIELYQLGLQVTARELIALRIKQLELRNKLVNLMKEKNINAWITPSTTSTAPLGLESTGSPLMSLPWTNAGLPSITIANGFNETGLPYGLQIIGSWQQDECLVEAAKLIANT
ncbi:MAG: amidase [Candidatus Cloacimonetes bacterium]|nr:amidase [Candidatus Cloacimonadota bacterium]